MTLSGRLAAVFAMVTGLSAIHVASVGDGIFPSGSALCMASMPVEETAASGIFRGAGVVKAIGATTGWLTLAHEEIKGFMPAMVMMYRVEPPELSAKLHVGDRVAFDIDAAHYTIIGAKIVERAK
jgi:Cu/Ag efflux protein CusF